MIKNSKSISAYSITIQKTKNSLVIQYSIYRWKNNGNPRETKFSADWFHQSRNYIFTQWRRIHQRKIPTSDNPNAISLWNEQTMIQFLSSSFVHAISITMHDYPCVLLVLVPIWILDFWYESTVCPKGGIIYRHSNLANRPSINGSFIYSQIITNFGEIPLQFAVEIESWRIKYQSQLERGELTIDKFRFQSFSESFYIHCPSRNNHSNVWRLDTKKKCTNELVQ